MSRRLRGIGSPVTCHSAGKIARAFFRSMIVAKNSSVIGSYLPGQSRHAFSIIRSMGGVLNAHAFIITLVPSHLSPFNWLTSVRPKMRFGLEFAEYCARILLED